MEMYCPNCRAVHEIRTRKTVLGGVNVLLIECCGCNTVIYISAIGA